MNVVSFGGGTNSTAMIIGMYLHKIPIDLILFADTGGEQRDAALHRLRLQALLPQAQDRDAGEVLQQLSTVQRGVGQRPARPQIHRLRCRGDTAHPTRRAH